MQKMMLGMMKMYQLFAWLGLILVFVAFLFSFQGANANALFFSVDKATREAAGAGSALALANVTRHTIPIWVPYLKFLGLGLMLGAITMALGLIATTLRDLGKDVMAKWPAKLNPGVPDKPASAKMFPMIMMMGWLLLIVAFVWALSLSGVAASYWNNSIAEVLNPAQTGSVLLAQLGTIVSTLPWISFLRWLGMAFLFTGITVALTVIIRTLQHQNQSLQKTFIGARQSS
jgi:hypothetical protein